MKLNQAFIAIVGALLILMGGYSCKFNSASVDPGEGSNSAAANSAVRDVGEDPPGGGGAGSDIAEGVSATELQEPDAELSMGPNAYSEGFQDYYEDKEASAKQGYALEQARNVLTGGKVPSFEELGQITASVAARTVIDAGVEKARELPWVKALEVGYKLPTDGSASLNADLLVALRELDASGNFVFSQIGARYKNNRFIGNLGLGYRRVSQDESWLWGVNTFLDYDFMGTHLRGGVGAEVKTALLDVFSNYYLPLTSWKKAYQHDYLEERAAEGYDFGLVGRLPFLRSVNWKTRYFRWYGENVDVYDNSKYLSNPNGMEFGAEWTPVKALSFGVTHSRAMDSNLQETRLEGKLNITFDELAGAWEKMDNKAGKEVGKRVNEFVNRQNDIVFERRVSSEGKALGVRIVKFTRE